MNLNSITKQIILLFVIVSLVSCDKDFNEIGTDIVGGDNNHYLGDKTTEYTVQAYNQKLGPVATNNLPINPLGIFSNPAFGTTTANFVTQLEIASASLNRTFNNVDPTLYQTLPIVDSVILNIPYFSKLKETTTNEDGEILKTYRLDSIYGESGSKFRLSIHESNYFLRNLDPETQFTEQQSFYNDNQSVENNITPGRLNNAPLVNTEYIKNADGRENEAFYFNKKEQITKTKNDDNEDVLARSVPSMRLHLDNNFFLNKIINAPSGQLVNNDVFKNYFRGLYFKVESLGNSNSLAMMNFAGGTVTVYYREDSKVTDAQGVVTFNKVDKSFVMNLTGNTISLQSNSNENADYITATNSTTEATSLYLKGGQGSMAVIDLFGPDTDGNGIADELEEIRTRGWLINEANLIFNIDKVKMGNAQTVEPNRIFLYDLNNKTVLVDYIFDQTTFPGYSKQNKYVHGGYILDENNKHLSQAKNDDGVITKKGTKYKIRITDHIKNLIRKDSTNVRLGLVVTETITNVGFTKLKTPIGIIDKIPTMSALNPLGTVLYGSHSSVADDKRLKLEIYYTKPD
ncbi:DUF4270 domain-containing protein [Flavobacterium solisilvae]|uniref:DUF4270 domain-containing protein n=1 Tax=Flavobacterium solisilvae TaxID=1852019 RepID=A0ABX1QTQ8_9FLAO|nr:DUF4270 domain-containing protein [Flavobacterium solisilvae]NMH25667.1 DUF4270 domain-containing protein [Flavobacterium solisilvae]